MDKKLLQEVKARLHTVIDDDWVLDRILGIGASASVYRAHRHEDQSLAIKVMHRRHQRSHTIRQRFIREQQVLQAIEHPHTLKTFGPPKQNATGEFYMLMELLEGSSLSQLMNKRGKVPMEPERVVHYMLPVLEVLQMCHTQNILHRDLKPANLFLTKDGVIKVLDFGLAKYHDDGLNLTRAGAALGTPSFMSPEQAGADVRHIDARSDLFAIGAVMHYLLCAQYIHEGATPRQTYFIAATTPAPSLAERAPNIPQELIELVDKAVAWDIEARWQSAQEMRSALSVLWQKLRPSSPSITHTSALPKQHTKAPTQGSDDLQTLALAVIHNSQATLSNLARLFQTKQREHADWTIQIQPTGLTSSKGDHLIWPAEAPLPWPGTLWSRGVRHLVLNPESLAQPAELHTFLEACRATRPLLALSELPATWGHVELSHPFQTFVAPKHHHHLVRSYRKHHQAIREAIAGEFALNQNQHIYTPASTPFEAQTQQQEFQILCQHLKRTIHTQHQEIPQRLTTLPLPKTTPRHAAPVPKYKAFEGIAQLILLVVAAEHVDDPSTSILNSLNTLTRSHGFKHLHLLFTDSQLALNGVQLSPAALGLMLERTPQLATIYEALKIRGVDELQLHLPLSTQDHTALRTWIQSGELLPPEGVKPLGQRIRLLPQNSSLQTSPENILAYSYSHYTAHILTLCVAMLEQLTHQETDATSAELIFDTLSHSIAQLAHDTPDLLLASLCLDVGPRDRALCALQAACVVALSSKHITSSPQEMVPLVMSSLLMVISDPSDPERSWRTSLLAHQLAPQNNSFLAILTFEALTATQTQHQQPVSLLGVDTLPDVRAIFVSMATAWVKLRTHASDSRGISQTDCAIETLQDTWLGTKIDRMIFALITRALGLCPKSSVVLTERGWRGLVLSNHDSPGAFAHPVVRLVYTPQEHVVNPPKDQDLRSLETTNIGETIHVDYKSKDQRVLNLQKRLKSNEQDLTLEAIPPLVPPTPGTVSPPHASRVDTSRSWLDGERSWIDDETIELINLGLDAVSDEAKSTPSALMRSVKMEDILHLVPSDLMEENDHPLELLSEQGSLTGSWDDLLDGLIQEDLISLHPPSEATSPLPEDQISELNRQDQGSNYNSHDT